MSFLADPRVRKARIPLTALAVVVLVAVLVVLARNGAGTGSAGLTPGGGTIERPDAVVTTDPSSSNATSSTTDGTTDGTTAGTTATSAPQGQKSTEINVTKLKPSWPEGFTESVQVSTPAAYRAVISVTGAAGKQAAQDIAVALSLSGWGSQTTDASLLNYELSGAGSSTSYSGSITSSGDAFTVELKKN